MEIKCHNCIHSSETPDGIGFYCDRPMAIAIECTKHGHKYFIAKPIILERNKLTEALITIHNYCSGKKSCTDCPFLDDDGLCMIADRPESWNTDKIDENLEEYYRENSDI